MKGVLVVGKVPEHCWGILEQGAPSPGCTLLTTVKGKIKVITDRAGGGGVVSGVTKNFEFLLSHKLFQPPPVAFYLPSLVTPGVIFGRALHRSEAAATNPLIVLLYGTINLKCNCRSSKMWGSSSKVRKQQKPIRSINSDSSSSWCFAPWKKLNHDLLACGLRMPRFIDCLGPLLRSVRSPQRSSCCFMKWLFMSQMKHFKIYRF